MAGTQALETGRVLNATSTTLVDPSKKWGTDLWKGFFVQITSGFGAGQVRNISTNSESTLTVSVAWDTIPTSDSFYAILGNLTINATLASPLNADGSVQVNEVNRAAFATAIVSVTTHGTPVQFGAQAIPNGFQITVKAKAGNTKPIHVGNSSAHAQYLTGIGYELSPGASIPLAVTNANLIWIDSEVDGEAVTWAVET